ncbi:MAG TPA: alkaline phosphatase family protein [Kofleriaceae bacterium]|nr:alkaline phosphatase family protein [Kofleriaceae bacterium]
MLLRISAWLAPLPLCAALACSSSQPGHGAHTAPPARLVVLMVIDQLPEWAFEAKQPHFTGMLRWAVDTGTWTVGQHPSAATMTAPGHSLLGTGMPPAYSGIIANEWWHRDLGKSLKSVEALDGGRSTMWLRVPGIGDAMARAVPAAKAVSISLKDRAALLPLGQSGGTAVYYDSQKVAWASTKPTSWVNQLNQTSPIAARLDYEWTVRNPDTIATLSGGPDNQPGELGEKGFGPTFPHRLRDTQDPADAVFATPLGNELVIEAAEAAVVAERLGADDVTDYLVVSFSANDYVAHGWGHESWEAWDIALRLDTSLADFKAFLDANVGQDRWSLIVTSDHGAAPLPERRVAVGRVGARYPYQKIIDAAQAAATAALGPGAWVADARYPTLYLSAAALALPATKRAAALQTMRAAIARVPGIAAAHLTSDIAGHCETRSGDEAAVCLALDSERSGEIVFLPSEGTVLHESDEAVATHHGSLWPYDRLVPVLLVAPGWRRSALPALPASLRPTRNIAMTQIAPTAAMWLGLPGDALRNPAVPAGLLQSDPLQPN